MYNTRNITNIYFKNYQWSITFKNCESLYYTSVTYSIKHQLYFSKKKKIVQLVKNPRAMRETPVQFLGGEICWRMDKLPTPVFLGFPCGSGGKESICSVGGLGSIPGLGRSPGEGNGYPLQYSGLENSMDYTVHGHKESDTTE